MKEILPILGLKEKLEKLVLRKEAKILWLVSMRSFHNKQEEDQRSASEILRSVFLAKKIGLWSELSKSDQERIENCLGTEVFRNKFLNELVSLVREAQKPDQILSTFLAFRAFAIAKTADIGQKFPEQVKHNIQKLLETENFRENWLKDIQHDLQIVLSRQEGYIGATQDVLESYALAFSSGYFLTLNIADWDEIEKKISGKEFSRALIDLLTYALHVPEAIDLHLCLLNYLGTYLTLVERKTKKN